MITRLASHSTYSDKRLEKIAGKSSDAKPTNVLNGSRFIEVDTGKEYVFDEQASSWTRVKNGGGGEDEEGFFFDGWDFTNSQSVKTNYTVGDYVSFENWTAAIFLKSLDEPSTENPAVLLAPAASLAAQNLGPYIRILSAFSPGDTPTAQLTSTNVIYDIQVRYATSKQWETIGVKRVDISVSLPIATLQPASTISGLTYEIGDTFDITEGVTVPVVNILVNGVKATELDWDTFTARLQPFSVSGLIGNCYVDPDTNALVWGGPETWPPVDQETCTAIAPFASTETKKIGLNCSIADYAGGGFPGKDGKLYGIAADSYNTLTNVTVTEAQA